jgi:ectoine hydroxylase-related dioxygenase (phytanoyl-CoA dioxygenase family)
MWMIDDFTAENGATWLVPGTHLRGRQPSCTAGEGDTPSVPVRAPADSVMIFDGLLWHQTGTNKIVDEHRPPPLNYYCRGFIRQQNFFVNARAGPPGSAGPRMRRLLGWENSTAFP